MRKCSLRKILKILSSDNRARVFEANSRACHPRIAISINEIDLPAEEHVTVIRAPCDENQCADENDFRQEREPPPHAPFKSAIRILQSEIFIECIRDWSPHVCYVLLSDRGGPVAQRLEQAIHNSLQALGSHLHGRNSIDSQRLQTTARDAENGNKWQRSRVAELANALDLGSSTQIEVGPGLCV